jgi:uncharacterized protein YacL
LNEEIKKQQKRMQFKLTKNFVARLLLGLSFFTLTFIISNTLIFREYPLFEIRFLGELLMATALGVFGFHTVPIILSKLRNWFETFLKSVVSSIVWDFWDQQSQRMRTARRKKQKESAKVSQKKLTEKYEDAILIDTSVLIDGRIVNLAKAGFFPASTALILNDVLNELHLLSDNADDMKRQKGRRGLDIVEDLKKSLKVKIVKYDIQDKENSQEVDKRLLSFAKHLSLRLMTLDFNLNKVAKAQNIKVLNINDLVEAVKSELIPGEKIKVKVLQKGKEKNQGVAYLPDGTMIVIENGIGNLGETVEVEVSRLIQSPAGKIIFSKVSQ